ncbi:MAG: signal peptidase II [Candidatus Syntrophosphaera sp.]|nr:signal peptidase II [Candidatus Syntrophosphaera sp.]
MTKLKTYPAYIIMGAVVALDQATKILIRSLIPEGGWITVGEKLFGDTFQICHLMNTGAAFSISLPNPLWNKAFFISTSVLAIIFIIWLLHHATHRIQVVAFGLVLGGAIGNNLIDRPIFGAVTDFISVDIPNLITGMDRFPVFNVADSAIFIGMCLLIVDLIFIREKKAADAKPEPLPLDDNC